jgi:hypothetical protein
MAGMQASPLPELKMKGRGRVWGYLTAALLAAAVSIAAILAIAPNPAQAFSCPAKPNLPSADGSQPPNLGILKLQLIDYKCFGAYDRDVLNMLNDARTFVEQRSMRAAPDEKLAIVLDIDETSVSNWQNLAADDFGFFSLGACTLKPDEPCGFNAWIEEHDPVPIGPTVKLFAAAKAKSVKVFFISARPERQRAATERHLRQEFEGMAHAYDGWEALILKQKDDPPAVADYKTAKRTEIEANGFKIIANVGDQESDLRGGHAERAFKVPNPFYYVP